MAFKKAAPQQAFVKMTLYGPPGSGKTFTALTMAEGLAKRRGKRVAMIDTEHGSDFYAKPVKARTTHPDGFDFDADYTRSIAAVLEDIRALDLSKYGVIVIDSISHIWEACIESWGGKKTKAETIPMHAWGQIKRPYKQLMALLVGLPCDVIICGRQKNVFEEDENDQIKKVGVALKAEGETQYEPHICARLETVIDPSDPNRTYCLMRVEKDRSSVLHGKKFVNPNFDTIAPILDVLNDKTQAPMEDEAERITQDADLLKKEAEEKQEKSKAIYADMHGKLATAESLEDLGAFVAAMKKSKKLLTDEHEAALVEMFNARREALANKVASKL